MHLVARGMGICVYFNNYINGLWVFMGIWYCSITASVGWLAVEAGRLDRFMTSGFVTKVPSVCAAARGLAKA